MYIVLGSDANMVYMYIVLGDNTNKLYMYIVLGSDANMVYMYMVRGDNAEKVYDCTCTLFLQAILKRCTTYRFFCTNCRETMKPPRSGCLTVTSSLFRTIAFSSMSFLSDAQQISGKMGRVPQS